MLCEKLKKSSAIFNNYPELCLSVEKWVFLSVFATKKIKRFKRK